MSMKPFSKSSSSRGTEIQGLLGSVTARRSIVVGRSLHPRCGIEAMV